MKWVNLDIGVFRGMIFFSLLFALLLEHWRPIGGQNRLILAFLSYADSLERYFNTGVRRHGIAAWIRRRGAGNRIHGLDLLFTL